MSDKGCRIAGIGLMLLAAVIAAAGALTSLHQAGGAAFRGRKIAPPEILPVSERLDDSSLVNTEDAESLCALPGIGPSIAELILREREENGVFHYPEDLTAVKGIGQKKLEQIRPMLAEDGTGGEE